MRWPFLTMMVGLSVAASLEAQDPAAVPLPTARQVNDSAVARGRSLFHGTAQCVACHGPEGVGTDSGPALAEGVWLHGPDSYEGILSRILHGLPSAWTTRGTPMPMRGWNVMTDEEARDVAAYVWTISHAWQPRPPARPPS